MKSLMLKAAKAAGKVVLKNYGRPGKIRFKNPRSIVTQTDILSEKIIIGAIKKKKDNLNYPVLNKPFNIPANWEWVYLTDVSIIQEGPGIRKYQYTDSGVQFLTVTNILEGSVDLNKSKSHPTTCFSFIFHHFTSPQTF